MAQKIELGKSGEALIAEYLGKKGYLIIDRNWRIKGGEIDLIASSPEGVIVFVEVKTRNGFEIPADKIVLSQQKLRIMKSAHAYIVRYNIMKEPRFDLITIFGEGPQMRISHIESYFYPTLISARSL